MSRSEYFANQALASMPRAFIGATFTKPAPIRPAHVPMVRPAYVVTLCGAILCALFVIL